MAFSSNTVFLYFSMKLVDIKQGLGDIGIIGTTKEKSFKYRGLERFAVPKIQKNGENGEILSPEKEEWLLGDSRIDPQY